MERKSIFIYIDVDINETEISTTSYEMAGGTNDSTGGKTATTYELH